MTLKLERPSIESQLYWAPSQIEGAGNGLYCHIAIRKGQKIGEYRGRLLPEEAAKNKYIDKRYFIETHILVNGQEKLFYIDGSDLIRNPLGYANHADAGTKRCNARARELDNGRVYVYATRVINADEEICWEYCRGWTVEDGKRLSALPLPFPAPLKKEAACAEL